MTMSSTTQSRRHLRESCTTAHRPWHRLRSSLGSVGFALVLVLCTQCDDDIDAPSEQSDSNSIRNGEAAGGGVVHASIRINYIPRITQSAWSRSRVQSSPNDPGYSPLCVVAQDVDGDELEFNFEVLAGQAWVGEIVDDGSLARACSYADDFPNCQAVERCFEIHFLDFNELHLQLTVRDIDAETGVSFQERGYETSIDQWESTFDAAPIVDTGARD